MTKECPICGKAYKPKRKDQPTCGDEDCRYIWRTEYCRRYMQKQRDEYRAELNEYNRGKMREYRAEHGYTYGQTKFHRYEPKEDTIIAEGYAERQKQKTLAMVGRVEI